MEFPVSGTHQVMRGAQIEPVQSPEALLTQQLEGWGGQLSLWDSDPARREFVVSVTDRGGPLWYKVSLHGDGSCVINEVYYSELQQGLSAVAARHGIRRVSQDHGPMELPDKKAKKSPLRIWRRLSIGTILRSDPSDRRSSPQKSPRQVRRSNSLRLFHGKVTRKFSLKNADQDPLFRPAASEGSLSPQTVSYPIVSGPVQQFVMPSPVEAPFTHATLPRASRGQGDNLVSVSAGSLPQHTDLDSAMVSEREGRSEKKRQRRIREKEFEFSQHRKLTRSQSMVRERPLGDSPPLGVGLKLSKYTRSSGRLDTESPDVPLQSRSGAHAYTSQQRAVSWRISRRTDERPHHSQTLTCPGDRPHPYVLDSRSAARFSVFPIESAVLKSGCVQTMKSADSRMPDEEAEGPKQIRSVFSIPV